MQPSFGIVKFLTHAELTRPGNKNLAADGTLVVTAKLRARTFEAAPLALPPLPSLQSELAELLSTGEDADVSIHVAGEHIAAHSFVLALRSSVLKAQLRGPFATAPPHVINVPDSIMAGTFKQLLRFLYTDEAPPFESHEAAACMLQAANYYGVLRLLSRSESALIAQLTAENAVATLALAHAHTRAELRASVLRFMAKEAAAVMATLEWSSLRTDHPELVEAVLHTVVHGEPPVAIGAAGATPAQQHAKDRALAQQQRSDNSAALPGLLRRAGAQTHPDDREPNALLSAHAQDSWHATCTRACRQTK